MLSYTTISNYRFAAHAAHTDFGLQSPFGDNKLVQLLMQSIRRVRALAGEIIVERLPVTREVLMRSMSLLNLSTFDDTLLAAAMWVATTGLFRPGEIAIDSPNDKSRLLTVSSLKRSGTDTLIH